MKIPVFVKILNALEGVINPATSEKQDAIISAISGSTLISNIETIGSITYIGSAVPSSLTSSPVWKIIKIDVSGVTTVKFADGNSNFDNVWDNRTSLTYL